MTDARNRIMLIAAIVTVGTLVALTGCQGAIDKAAAAKFQKSLGQTSLAVFPAYIRTHEPYYDVEVAERLATYFRARKLGTVAVVDAQVPITGEWRMNQHRMFRAGIADLGTHVAQHGLETDYAVMAEYLGGRDEFCGVHLYVVDGDGRAAYGTGLNSHHAEFRPIPKTVDECTQSLIRKLDTDMHVARGDAE